MANTIKVIDLLNKIANGEEMPEKIKYKGNEYWYKKNRQDYKDAVVSYDSYLIDSKYHAGGWLNDTVEILEEQQDIDIQDLEEIDKEWTYVEGLVEKTWSVAELEIIENLNKLVSAVKQLDRNIKDKE